MSEKIRCQSCGMPLAEVTEPLYCQFCYKDGELVEPELDVQGMIDKSVAHMVSEFNMERESALDLAASIIPTLGRWKK